MSHTSRKLATFLLTCMALAQTAWSAAEESASAPLDNDTYPAQLLEQCGSCHVLPTADLVVEPWSYKVFSNIPYKVAQVRVQNLTVRYPQSPERNVWEMIIEFENEADAREVAAYEMIRIGRDGSPRRAGCFLIGKQMIMAAGNHHVLFIHPEHPQYHMQVLSAFDHE